MNKNKTLCPFCLSGKTEIVTMSGKRGFFSFVRCNNCKAQGPIIGHNESGDPILDAVVAWGQGAVNDEGEADAE